MVKLFKTLLIECSPEVKKSLDLLSKKVKTRQNNPNLTKMSQQQIKSKIIEYYRDLLCREPDKDGLDHYLKMANNGT